MIKKLYVHGGSFHADDVFCAAVLSIINRNLEVERVLITGKDLTDLENGILMADIGGGAFDHHQEDAAIRKDGIKHSAVTLLWKKYGHDCIRAVAPDVTEEGAAEISDTLYNGLLREIAVLDNGIAGVLPEGVTDISELIALFNPSWDSDEDHDKAFDAAVSFAREVLVRKIKLCASAHKAVDLVKEAIRKMDDGIIVLERNFPWEHIVVQEPEAKIVIYPSARSEIDLRLVPVEEGSFTTRLDVPDEWKGKRNEETEAYMHGMVFCHANGFVMSFDNFENAIAAAHYIVELNRK